MDEAVAGHATCIDISLDSNDRLTIRDNGCGIQQKNTHPNQSTVEVIATTLHAGVNFRAKPMPHQVDFMVLVHLL